MSITTLNLHEISQGYLLNNKNNHRTIISILDDNFMETTSYIIRHLKFLYQFKETFIINNVAQNKDQWCSSAIRISGENILVYRYNKNNLSTILGKSCDILILENFNSLSPNELAQTWETVRGKGIIFINNNIDDKTGIKNLTLNKFNDRIIELLSKSGICLYTTYKTIESEINHDSSTSDSSTSDSSTSDSDEINETDQNMKKDVLNSEYYDTKLTLEQINVVGICFDRINTYSKIYFNSRKPIITSIIASRGRGKTTCLGIILLKCIEKRIPNIYITSNQIENTTNLFNFVVDKLKQCGFNKDDFKFSFREINNVSYIDKIIICNILIKFINPYENFKYNEKPDVLFIDEASSIPLVNLKNILQAKNVFLATTIDGYEGTGRSFQLKLNNLISSPMFDFKILKLDKPIRYGQNDPTEKWLKNALVLSEKDFDISNILECSELKLFYINRKTLFNSSDMSEILLSRIFSLFISSHYKNSPNDLKLLTDLDNHEIFILSNPRDKLDIYCAIQIAFEGNIVDIKSTEDKSGNLIPWSINSVYLDNEFPKYSGIRIVRIATKSNIQSRGYGSFAMESLILRCKDLKSKIKANKFLECSKDEDAFDLTVPIENINFTTLSWIGTSFGLTERLLRFWNIVGMVPVNINFQISFNTSEHNILCLKGLNNKKATESIQKFTKSSVFGFLNICPMFYRDLDQTTILSIIYSSLEPLSNSGIDLTENQLKSLSLFLDKKIQVSFIFYLIPQLARFYFYKKTYQKLTLIEEVVLVSIGIQMNSLDILSKKLKMSQIEIKKIIYQIVFKIEKILF